MDRLSRALGSVAIGVEAGGQQYLRGAERFKQHEDIQAKDWEFRRQLFAPLAESLGIELESTKPIKTQDEFKKEILINPTKLKEQAPKLYNQFKKSLEEKGTSIEDIGVPDIKPHNIKITDAEQLNKIVNALKPVDEKQRIRFENALKEGTIRKGKENYFTPDGDVLTKNIFEQ